MIVGAGYEVSKLNAMKHGVLSKVTILPLENADEYSGLLNSLIAEYAPATPTQEHLVEELAGIIWRKRRLKLAEKYLFNDQLEKSTDTFSNTAKRALISFDGHDQSYKYKVPEAVCKSDEQNKETVEEFREHLKLIEKQLKIVKKSDTYEKAIESMENYFVEIWEDHVSEYSSRKRDLDTLKGFLDKEINEWENNISEIEARPIVKEQAIGYALFPTDRHEKLQRYETSLDRKFEKTLSVLIKLQEISAGSSDKPEAAE